MSGEWDNVFGERNEEERGETFGKISHAFHLGASSTDCQVLDLGLTAVITYPGNLKWFALFTPSSMDKPTDILSPLESSGTCTNVLEWGSVLDGSGSDLLRTNDRHDAAIPSIAVEQLGHRCPGAV